MPHIQATQSTIGLSRCECINDRINSKPYAINLILMCIINIIVDWFNDGFQFTQKLSTEQTCVLCLTKVIELCHKFWIFSVNISIAISACKTWNNFSDLSIPPCQCYIKRQLKSRESCNHNGQQQVYSKPK